jgi:hypothetical protein
MADSPHKALPRRILVVGPSGAGKTTLAKRLSALSGIPHVELDALYWGPNWTKRESFEQDVADSLTRGEWIVDGGFGPVKESTWPQSELVVWLDPPLVPVMVSQVRRSIRRICTRQELFGGNRETFRGYFLSRKSLFIWLLKSHKPMRQKHSVLSTLHPSVPVRRFTTRHAAEAWLASMQPR